MLIWLDISKWKTGHILLDYGVLWFCLTWLVLMGMEYPLLFC
jgi:hypothetical protein